MNLNGPESSSPASPCSWRKTGLLGGKAGDIAWPQKILEDRAQKSTICSASAPDRAQAALYAQN
ncbi:hypothetical protein APV28_1331 [Comamonas testosteroni]|nr:hypothetical protein APV28_1331 [Comamonas testosteroni]